MPRFTREHLFHIRPVGSLVEETHESGHELKRDVPNLPDIEADADAPETPITGAR